MSWDKGIALTVLLAGLALAGTFGPLFPEEAPKPKHESTPSAAAVNEIESSPGASVEPAVPRPRSEEDDATRVAMRRALLEAVQRARRESPAGQGSEVEPDRIDAGEMPDMEMTWEQYRGWTKFAAALADRDYKKSESMFPALQALFGEPLVSAMVDAYVEDYRTFLVDVTESRCYGYDPQSVWRKTLFMTFALARLSRSSALLESSANEARAICGYEG